MFELISKSRFRLTFSEWDKNGQVIEQVDIIFKSLAENEVYEIKFFKETPLIPQFMILNCIKAFIARPQTSLVHIASATENEMKILTESRQFSDFTVIKNLLKRKMIDETDDETEMHNFWVKVQSQSTRRGYGPNIFPVNDLYTNKKYNLNVWSSYTEWMVNVTKKAIFYNRLTAVPRHLIHSTV